MYNLLPYCKAITIVTASTTTLKIGVAVAAVDIFVISFVGANIYSDGYVMMLMIKMMVRMIQDNDVIHNNKDYYRHKIDLTIVVVF